MSSTLKINSALSINDQVVPFLPPTKGLGWYPLSREVNHSWCRPSLPGPLLISTVQLSSLFYSSQVPTATKDNTFLHPADPIGKAPADHSHSSYLSLSSLSYLGHFDHSGYFCRKINYCSRFEEEMQYNTGEEQECGKVARQAYWLTLRTDGCTTL